MKKLAEALWKDYDDNTEIINNLELGTTEYQKSVEERDNIRNELIKLKQIEESSKNEKNKFEFDNKNQKIINYISIGTFLISSLITVVAINKTFKFDKEGSVTSTLGKNILSGSISKLFKK